MYSLKTERINKRLKINAIRNTITKNLKKTKIIKTHGNISEIIHLSNNKRSLKITYSYKNLPDYFQAQKGKESLTLSKTEEFYP